MESGITIIKILGKASSFAFPPTASVGSVSATATYDVTAVGNIATSASVSASALRVQFVSSGIATSASVSGAALTIILNSGSVATSAEVSSDANFEVVMVGSSDAAVTMNVVAKVLGKVLTKDILRHFKIGAIAVRDRKDGEVVRVSRVLSGMLIAL